MFCWWSRLMSTVYVVWNQVNMILRQKLARKFIIIFLLFVLFICILYWFLFFSLYYVVLWNFLEFMPLFLLIVPWCHIGTFWGSFFCACVHFFVCLFRLGKCIDESVSFIYFFFCIIQWECGHSSSCRVEISDWLFNWFANF